MILFCRIVLRCRRFNLRQELPTIVWFCWTSQSPLKSQIRLRASCGRFRAHIGPSLRAALTTTHWTSIVDSLSVDRAVEAFTEHVFHTAKLHIPCQKCSMQKSAHPWLNERCATAVARKCAAAGTSGFAAAQHECSSVLSEEYYNHVNRLRSKLSTLPKGSKRWWKLNRELWNKKSATSSIPPLKSIDGSDVLDPEAKANLQTVLRRSVFCRRSVAI